MPLFTLAGRNGVPGLQGQLGAVHGSWIQVIDEPVSADNATLANTLATMRLYKAVDPRIDVFQTRWPNGGGAAAAAAQAQGLRQAQARTQTDSRLDALPP